MSLMKYFAPPEWDADVPEATHVNDLIPRTKSKKKNKLGDECNDVSNKEHKLQDVKSTKSVDVLEVSKKKNKRRVISDDSEIVSKKKLKLSSTENVSSNDLSQKKSTPKNKKRKSNLDNLVKSNGKPAKNEISKNALKKLKRKSKDINSVIPEGNKDLIENIQKKLEKRREERREKKKNKKEKRTEVVESSKSEIEKSNNTNKKQKSNVVSNISPNKNKTKVQNPKSPSTYKSQEIMKLQHDGDSTPKPLTQTEKNRRRRRKKNKTFDSNTTHNNTMEKTEDSKIVPKQISGTGSMKKNVLKNKLMNILTQSLEHKDKLSDQDDKGKVSEMENTEQRKKKQLPMDSQPKTLRERMMEKLKGARFRYLNEQMYSKESKDAKRLFHEDPKAFSAYHDGYRQQVNKWPLNPLDIIIKDISKLPKEHVIADLGCGDARLSKSIPHKVHSFDLVALDPCVQACDMAHTPLLTGQINVVVFCLSLMGTNLKDYVIEANRILKVGGLMKIAEVESRFEKVEDFTKEIQKYGFKLLKSDLTQNLFYFMDFKKEKDIVKRNKLPHLTLKPCLYKKR